LITCEALLGGDPISGGDYTYKMSAAGVLHRQYPYTQVDTYQGRFSFNLLFGKTL
jgi:hypothetical protein